MTARRRIFGRGRCTGPRLGRVRLRIRQQHRRRDRRRTPTSPARPWTCWSRPTRSTRSSRSSGSPTSRPSSRRRPAPRSPSRRSPRPTTSSRRSRPRCCPGRARTSTPLGTTFTPTAYATGAFLELSDGRLDEDRRPGQVPAGHARASPVRTASHQVGIPFASRPFVMAYNKDLLAAAGIDKPATTWDGLLAQAKKLTTGRHLRAGDRLRRRLRPVEVHLGDERPGRQPAGRRRQGAARPARPC